MKTYLKKKKKKKKCNAMLEENIRTNLCWCGNSSGGDDPANRFACLVNPIQASLDGSRDALCFQDIAFEKLGLFPSDFLDKFCCQLLVHVKDGHITSLAADILDTCSAKPGGPGTD